MAQAPIFCASLGFFALLPICAFAQAGQADQEGGFVIALTLAEDLALRDPDQRATTNLDFALRTQTRTQLLRFGVGGSYILPEAGFTSPRAHLSYQQTAAASSISLSANTTQTDLDAPARITDPIDPDRFTQANTSGTRDHWQIGGILTLRDDAPFGLRFDVTHDDIRYRGQNTLVDRVETQINATARFDISPVLQSNLGLRYHQINTHGHYGITTDLIARRPTGDITVTLAATHSDDGAQQHLAAHKDVSTPGSSARLGLGISQASTDDLVVTGQAAFAQHFAPNSRLGPITASADRHLTRDADIVTSLSVTGSYALSPLADLQLAAAFARSQDLTTDTIVDLPQAEITVYYALTPDWRAHAGIRRQAHDTGLSFGLTRRFDLRR